MESWIRCLAIVALCLATTACGEPGEADNAPADPCEDLPWNFANTGEPFMRDWCTSCHHSELEDGDRPPGTQGVNFDSYEDVFERLERIESRALTTLTMPPAGGPPEDQLQRLQEWIDCGAPRE